MDLDARRLSGACFLKGLLGFFGKFMGPSANANALVYTAETPSSAPYVTSIKSTTVHSLHDLVQSPTIRMAGRQETNLKCEYFFFISKSNNNR